MAITISRNLPGTTADTADYPIDVFQLGAYKAVFRVITMDDAYASGGESLAPSDIGFAKIYAVAVLSANTAALSASYDVANEKFVVYPVAVPAYGTTADTVIETPFPDLTNVQFTVLIVGR